MIGGIILVSALVIGMCAWMAFGDDDPRWVRGMARNLGVLAGCGIVVAIVVWFATSASHSAP